MRAQTTFRRGRWARGTAIMEFIMLIPIMALIIGLTFFFGWSMHNQQNVKISDRYAAWKEVLLHADYCRDPNFHDDWWDWHVSPGDVNDIFFSHQAGQLTIDYGSGPDDTLENLVSYVGTGSARAETLAGTLVLGSWPRGRSALVRAEVPSTVGLWRNLGLNGAIGYRFTRDGLQWRLREARAPWTPIRDQFLPVLDTVMTTIPIPGHLWGQAMRGLYINGW